MIYDEYEGFFTCTSKKALIDENECKLHMLIAKLESSHICPPDSYDHAFCPYCGECWR